MGIQRSIAAFEAGQSLLPGGVSSPARSFSPVFAKRAEGGYIFDIDGNRYLDLVNGLGPMILGHNHPAVTEAICLQAKTGLVYALPTEIEYELAQLIIDSTSCIERLRFVCSGTEAVMSAIRVAKAVTSRPLILKFAGSYHGHSDVVLAKGTKKHMASTEMSWINNGLDRHVVQNTIVVEYNDIDQVRGAFKSYPDQIAAVIVEPCATNMGIVPSQDGFLEELRLCCSEQGTLLIFDEVVSGFRFRFGSISEQVGVEPDLITFGKIIGGGTSIGAYGGRAEYLDVLRTKGGVFQGGTFAGNPLAMSAGLAQLKILRRPGFYERMNSLGEVVENTILRGFSREGLPFSFQRKGSLFSLILGNEMRQLRNLSDVRQQNAGLFAKLHWQLMQMGVLLPPSIEEPGFISAAHTEAELINMANHIVGILAEECIEAAVD